MPDIHAFVQQGKKKKAKKQNSDAIGPGVCPPEYQHESPASDLPCDVLLERSLLPFTLYLLPWRNRPNTSTKRQRVICPATSCWSDHFCLLPFTFCLGVIARIPARSASECPAPRRLVGAITFCLLPFAFCLGVSSLLPFSFCLCVIAHHAGPADGRLLHWPRATRPSTWRQTDGRGRQDGASAHRSP